MRTAPRAGWVAASALVAVVAAGCGAPVATGPTPPTSTSGATDATGTAPPGARTTTVPTTTTAPTTTTTPTTTAPTTSGPATLAVGAGAAGASAVQPQPGRGTCHYTYVGPYPLPDPSCTPGAVDPRVTPADLGTTICSRGWTASVRPPETVTGPEKVASAAAYGYTGSFATAEYDHLVPLELGGDPNDPANLWVEPNDRPGATTFANTKDGLEDHLRALVCDGSLPLAVAQHAIAVDWVAALQRYGS